MQIKLTLASSKDRGITIRTSQLDTRLVFSDGDEYYLKIKNVPVAIPMTLNRNGKSLYSGALDPYVAALLHITVGLPTIGNPSLVDARLGKNLKLIK